MLVGYICINARREYHIPKSFPIGHKAFRLFVRHFESFLTNQSISITTDDVQSHIVNSKQVRFTDTVGAVKDRIEARTPIGRVRNLVFRGKVSSVLRKIQ
jgi:hypothetical protein